VSIAKPLRHESRRNWSATEVSLQRLRVLITCLSALLNSHLRSCIDCDIISIEFWSICNYPTSTMRSTTVGSTLLLLAGVAIGQSESVVTEIPSSLIQTTEEVFTIQTSIPTGVSSVCYEVCVQSPCYACAYSNTANTIKACLTNYPRLCYRPCYELTRRVFAWSHQYSASVHACSHRDQCADGAHADSYYQQYTARLHASPNQRCLWQHVDSSRRDA
jgi:hypothetical protein